MTHPRPDLRRLFWVGPLTVVAANLAVLTVRVIAFAVLTFPRPYAAMRWGTLLTFTTVLVTTAVAVFAIVASISTNPARVFRRIALVVLLVSFIPDLRLPFTAPQFTWAATFVLMAMHVAAWWSTVTILTTLGLGRSWNSTAV